LLLKIANLILLHPEVVGIVFTQNGVSHVMEWAVLITEDLNMIYIPAVCGSDVRRNPLLMWSQVGCENIVG
jgi:hypothetical protein